VKGERRCPRCEGSLASVAEDVRRREAIESVLSPSMSPKLRERLVRATLEDETPGTRLSAAVRAQVERATRAALRADSESAAATATALADAQARLMAVNERATRDFEALVARDAGRVRRRRSFEVLVVLFAIAAAVMIGWLLFAT
jgi:hypothetical protein